MTDQSKSTSNLVKNQEKNDQEDETPRTFIDPDDLATSEMDEEGYLRPIHHHDQSASNLSQRQEGNAHQSTSGGILRKLNSNPSRHYEEISTTTSLDGSDINDGYLDLTGFQTLPNGPMQPVNQRQASDSEKQESSSARPNNVLSTKSVIALLAFVFLLSVVFTTCFVVLYQGRQNQDNEYTSAVPVPLPFINQTPQPCPNPEDSELSTHSILSTSVQSWTKGCDEIDEFLYNKNCYVVEIHSDSDVNFTDAEAICSGRCATPAYPVDQQHYDAIENAIRAKIPSGFASARIWLGLRQNISDGKVTLLDGNTIAPYSKWARGYPKAFGSYAYIYMTVYKEINDTLNGMMDDKATWKWRGVVCQQKIL